MGQEFLIKSQQLEDKINQLLPSQGGLQAGVDLSASTQIIPIVDLTESAEGSNVRADLQTAFSFNNTNEFAVHNTTSDIIITTGYYRVFGCANIISSTTASLQCFFRLTDGSSTKSLLNFFTRASSNADPVKQSFDFTIFLSAGDKLQAECSANCDLIGSFRQIADISGNLSNPT